MADATKTPDAKDTLELLKQLAAVVAQDETAPAERQEPAWSEVTGAVSAADVSNSHAGAVTAFARFRSTMRWLVGVIGAVGLVLFGSTAFTDGIDIGHWRVWLGLGTAAAGLVAVLYSATRVQEPEDASLGELLAVTAQLSRSWTRRRLKPAVFAYVRILERERRQLELAEQEPAEQPAPDRALSEEESARGAGTIVKALIDKIVLCVEERSDPSTELASARVAAAEIEAALDATTKRRDHLATTLTTIVSNPEVPAADKAAARAELAPLVADASRRIAAVEAIAARTSLRISTAAARLQRTDVPLRRALLERDIIINEYAVAQIRDTFRKSRRWLLLGAALTLVGTILYLAGSKSDSTDGDDREDAGRSLVVPGTIEFSETDPAFIAVPSSCRGVELDVFFGSVEVPAPDAAYRVTVVAPSECIGEYAVPEGTTGDSLELGTPSGRPLPAPP